MPNLLRIKNPRQTVTVSQQEVDQKSGTTVIIKRGPQGPPGPPGGVSFVHEQTTPASTWTIPHGQNRFPAAVTILAGDEDISYPDYKYPDADTLVVEFPSPATGKTYL